MIAARTEQTICFDVDDTLLMWDENHTQPFDGCVKVTCPHDRAVTYHRPHNRHVEFLKKQALKGHTVVVWSASGVGWATAAIDALGIEPYVDFAMSKPVKWVDDLTDPGDVLGIHIYLNEDGYSK